MMALSSDADNTHALPLDLFRDLKDGEGAYVTGRP
jgi:hypothetical protein